jgi:hypothetical protein
MFRLARRHCLLVPGVVVVASLTTARASEPISPEQFKQLQTVIKPAPSEDKWAQIPWMTDLWEARRRAAAAGKPLLVWEMDGHPLACV